MNRDDALDRAFTEGELIGYGKASNGLLMDYLLTSTEMMIEMAAGRPSRTHLAAVKRIVSELEGRADE